MILPLEDGLVLTHLLLDLVQEEGVLLTLGVAFHGGQPGFYSSTLPTSRMLPLADWTETQTWSPKVLLEVHQFALSINT